MAVYAGERVSHAWMLDPVARMIEARRLENGLWTSVATRVGNEIVHLEPFEAVDLALARLWGDQSEEELPAGGSVRPSCDESLSAS